MEDLSAFSVTFPGLTVAVPACALTRASMPCRTVLDISFGHAVFTS
jgi:hypothetical protein